MSQSAFRRARKPFQGHFKLLSDHFYDFCMFLNTLQRVREVFVSFHIIFQFIAYFEERVKSCGPQTASGTYVYSCENLLVSPANNFRNVADATIFYIAAERDGSYTGTLYEKVGSYLPVETKVLGKTAVNQDCSFSQTLLIPEYFPDGPPVDIRGVFYDEGKKFYSMPMTDGILGFCQGKRVTSNNLYRIDE